MIRDTKGVYVTLRLGTQDKERAEEEGGGGIWVGKPRRIGLRRRIYFILFL